MAAGAALTASGVVATTQACAQSTARYRLTVAIDWSRETHPLEFPSNAHVSSLIGATHSTRYVVFADGRTASSGLELVAENGRTSILEAELAEAARRGRVDAVFMAKGLAQTPGTRVVEFRADRDRSLLSFVAMLAPSPDWFTGLASVDLAPGGDWVERLEAPLWAWDAGTDGGARYAAPNLDTQPRESVRLLATAPFLGADGLKRVGIATVVRLER